MGPSSRPLPAQRGGPLSAALAAARQHHTTTTCPELHDERYLLNGRKPMPRKHQPRPATIPVSQQRQQRLLHMSDCEDPDCPDADQLKEWEKSLDRFTDYDHYERCCDEGGHHHHHCSHGLVIEKADCCERGPSIALSTPRVADGSRDCEDCFDNCDECVEAHDACYEEVDICEDDCEQCEDECEERGHDREDCPQDHPTTRDNCIDNCSIPLPLLGPTNEFDLMDFSNMASHLTPCTDDCGVSVPSVEVVQPLIPEPVFNTEYDHWQTFVQTHHCAPDPCTIGEISHFAPPQHLNPAFGFSFGCDPTVAANQYPWQHDHRYQQPQCANPYGPMSTNMDVSFAGDTQEPHATPTLTASSASPSGHTQESTKSPTASTEVIPDRTCQWVMPCGSICGALFSRTEDLKKHVKNSHSVKGTVRCGWRNCSSSFATEAALTGHISKKHLAFDEEGPWKCTFANCTKSFMYKQVRDEHVASHNGGNRMHCPICHQWLNAEGSNFRRHMASHNPKHEHMKCKYEHLGCKKRFPRVDNLRRHETCCKFGKKVLGVHHHHHKVHLHQ